MKKFFKTINNNILITTIIFDIIVLLFGIINNFFGITYRRWVFYFIVVITIVGIVIGTIQKLKGKSNKIKILVVCIFTIITTIIAINLPKLMILFAFSYQPEYVIEKDNKKYVANVRSFLQVNVDYYDYINFLLVGKNVRITEWYGKGGYNPFDGEHNDREVLETYYYDKNGEPIKDNNDDTKKENEDNNIENTDTISIEEKQEKFLYNEGDIIYEKKINEKIFIRVKYLAAVIAQRSVINIEKTTDGGITWKKQLEEGKQIHNGAKFVFINENIGFINDPGLAGTEGTNRGLMVTTNGGKSFKDANIIYSDSIEEKNLFVDDVPYIENGKLKVKIYTINYKKNPVKTYYEFYSEDNGVSWKYNE